MRKLNKNSPSGGWGASILVIGSGSAALCAGIAALEKGASVLMIEKADEKEWGGNSRYTAGAMRFAYDSFEDLKPLLKNPTEEKIAISDFGRDRKSTRLNSSHVSQSRMPSSA